MELFANLTVNFLINLLAGIFGIVIVLWLERLRRPALSLNIGTIGGIPNDDPMDRPECKFLHVAVRNRNVPNWLSWVYQGEPALMCKAWISFHHLDGYKVYDREMVGKWSQSGDPDVIVIDRGEKGTAIRLANIQISADIPPGESTDVDIAIRVKDEEIAYGWCNESYLYQWRHPSWRLDKGRFIVKVRVQSMGREYTDMFMVVNDVPYDDFRLHPLDDSTKALVRERGL